MALLLLRNEAACLVPDMKTELVSSRVPPELSRSPLPRERFRPVGLMRSFSDKPPSGLPSARLGVASRWHGETAVINQDGHRAESTTAPIASGLAARRPLR